MPIDSDEDRLTCKCCGEVTRQADAPCLVCQHSWDEYCDRHQILLDRAEFEKELYGDSPGDLEKELYGV